jgi:DNA sulfur modification protein DndD
MARQQGRRQPARDPPYPPSQGGEGSFLASVEGERARPWRDTTDDSDLLLFHTVTEEQDAYFEVRRSWHVREGRVKEILSVFKDGVYDAWYSDNWPQQVEELVPLEISQLFFFDAEKIRTLTEDETSSQALGSAIKSLLGLDIVERLIADAAVIQARQAKEGATPGQREKVEALSLPAGARPAPPLEQPPDRGAPAGSGSLDRDARESPPESR